MLDFRLREDQEKGTGYRVFCDSCGQTSLSSHALSYCPVCGRDKLILTPIVVNKIGEERKAYHENPELKIDQKKEEMKKT